MNQPEASLPANFRFSQSSLQDYAECARRFQLRYLENITYPAVETEPALENEKHQQEGELFHRLAQQYLIGIPADKLAPLANTPNLQAWWENFTAFSQASLSDEKILYPEITLSARTGVHRLLAKYDLIAITPGSKATIYDWKTYRRRPANEWLAARLQTRVYRALLVEAGAHLNGGRAFEPGQVEMIYWLANSPHESVLLPYTDAQARRDKDMLVKLIEEISNSDHFPKTDEDKNCRFCTYRSYCERGTLAGSLDEVEGELEPSEQGFDLNFEQITEIAF